MFRFSIEFVRDFMYDVLSIIIVLSFLIVTMMYCPFSFVMIFLILIACGLLLFLMILISIRIESRSNKVHIDRTKLGFLDIVDVKRELKLNE